MRCELCGYNHDMARRCPVYRFNAAVWVNSEDASTWPVAVPVHALSSFDVVCPHCRARSWRGEHVDCCGRGRLQLQFEDDVPIELAEVILSSHVRQHIRRHESIFDVTFCVSNGRQVQYGVCHGFCGS